MYNARIMLFCSIDSEKSNKVYNSEYKKNRGFCFEFICKINFFCEKTQ